jgi:hypothetical protein
VGEQDPRLPGHRPDMTTRRHDLGLPGNGGRFAGHGLAEGPETDLVLAAASAHPAQDDDMTTSPVSTLGHATDLEILRGSDAPAFVHSAIRLAHDAHRGQTDKQGRDYFDAHLRPIADALRPFGPEAEAVGWLHDCPEDTSVTYDDLRADGQPEDVVMGVWSMTRQVNERTGRNEPYMRLIERSKRHPLGRIGKLADNTWNILSSLSLRKIDPVKAESMLNGRYIPARKVLLANAPITGAQIHAMQVILRGHLIRLEGMSPADVSLAARLERVS